MFEKCNLECNTHATNNKVVKNLGMKLPGAEKQLQNVSSKWNVLHIFKHFDIIIQFDLFVRIKNVHLFPISNWFIYEIPSVGKVLPAGLKRRDDIMNF